jgi:hypothetical protein
MSKSLVPYLRYDDLVAANIVGSWTQLGRMIERDGFPPGIRLTPNIRAWRLDEIETWLSARPVERKIVPKSPGRPRKPPRKRTELERLAAREGMAWEMKTLKRLQETKNDAASKKAEKRNTDQ